MQDPVEPGVLGSNPGPDPGVETGVLARIDVDATDDGRSVRCEDRVGEADACLEIVGVPLEVAAVVVDGHLVGPGRSDGAGRGEDVVDAGGPGGAVAVVVLRPERLQAVAVDVEMEGRLEAFGDEGSHPRMVPRDVMVATHTGRRL